MNSIEARDRQWFVRGLAGLSSWIVVSILFLGLVFDRSRLIAQEPQEVLLVVCQYAGTEDPEFLPQQWADELNDRVNLFYQRATQGAVEFSFVPVPQILELEHTYESTEEGGLGETSSERLVDDPGTIDREGRLALIHARDAFPEKFSEAVWLYAIVNRNKRGRATQMRPFHTLDAPGGGLWINAAVAVISDPIAVIESGTPSLNPSPADLDGDGLSNGDESAVGGDPEDWDTDGDGLSDGDEVSKSLTQVFSEDTDGDGFSDWLEFSLGTSDPLRFDALRLPSETISLVAHELGHNLGLPDLYGDKRYFSGRPYEYWGMMASDNLQNFGAFSRREKRWHEPAFGQRVVNVGPAGVGAQTFNLVEPERGFTGNSSPESVTELIRIRRQFYPEVLLEARPKLLNDAARAAVGSSRLGTESGLPSYYQSGVLMSEVDARFDESGSNVRFIFGEPIVKVVTVLGEGDPGPEREAFDLMKGTVEGPGQVVIQLGLGPRSQFDVALDDTVVETLLDTRDDDGVVQIEKLFVSVPEGSHDLSIKHSLPFGLGGRSGGTGYIASIFYNEPPKFLNKPVSAIGRPGGTTDLSMAYTSRDFSSLRVSLQRENGTGVWNDFAGAQLHESFIRFLNVSPTDAGTYRVQLADSIGVVNSDPFTLEVMDPVTEAIKIHLGATDLDWSSSSVAYPWVLPLAENKVSNAEDLPVGFPISLTATVEGPVLLKFDWSSMEAGFEFFVDENPVASIDMVEGDSRETELTPGTHVLRWTLTRTSTEGTGSLGPLRTIRTPVITRVPRPRMVSEGETANMWVSVVPNGVAETTFQWFKNGAPVPGETSAFLTISSTSASDAGLYSVRVGSAGSLPFVDSPGAELRIKPNPADNLVGARFNDFGMESWTAESNLDGWEGLTNFIKSFLHSPKLANAPIVPGETYSDDTGLEVTVGEFDETRGIYEVTVRSDPPPIFSDLEVVGGWLDSHEFNGAGTYIFGRSGDYNDPNLGGDPVYVKRRPAIGYLGPVPVPSYENITSTHRVRFRVKNVGLGAAEDITGTIFFLHPHIFIGPILFDHTAVNRNRLSELAFGQEEVSIGSLDVAETRVVSATLLPEGPFQAVLLLDRVHNESVFWNNFDHKIFWVEFTWFGSPYKPIDLDIDFENINPFKHLMFPRLTGLPSNWGASVTDPVTGERKSATSLNPGERDAFQIQVSPPEATLLKPGTPVQIGVEGWMDAGDTYVPIGEIPIVVALTHPTELSLNVKLSSVDASLSGQLRYVTLNADGSSGPSQALADSLVTVEIVGSDGSLQELRLTTGEQGEFIGTGNVLEGVYYIATAYYNGSAAYQPMESEPLNWGELSRVVIRQLQLSANLVPELARVGFEVGEFKPEGGQGPYKYELVLGQGDRDNSRFRLNDHQLILDGAVDYERETTLSIRVRVSDQRSSATLERAFELTVINSDNEDADRDGLSEKLERDLGTSDLRLDSDGDGYPDLIEADLGVDPADPETFPVARWKEVRRIEFENPIAARWSPLDRRIYVGRRNVEGQDGLYRVEVDGSTKLVAAGDRLSGVVVVPDEKAVFFSEDFAGEVNRVNMVLGDRDPSPATAAAQWVSVFHSGDDDPIGMAWAPRDGQKRAVPAGHVVVVDRGNNGPDEIWTFNPAKAGSEVVLHRDNDTLRDPVDLAIGETEVYVLDAAAPISRLRLFRVSARGGLASVPHYGLDGAGRGIVVDPVSHEILLMMDEGESSRIHRLNPITGGRRVELSGFSSNPSASCLDLSSDGNTLVVTDHAADLVLVYERVYLPDPEIESFSPKFASPGDLIRVNGSGLREISGVWVDGVKQAFEEEINGFQFRLSADSREGIIRVKTLAGEVLSSSPVRIPHAPTEIRLTENTLSLAQSVGAVIGRFSVVDPDLGDQFQFELVSNDLGFDNEFYRIEGANLILAQLLLPNEAYRHRVQVRVTDRFGLSLSQSFELILAAVPNILFSPESVVVGTGEEARFEVFAEESPPLLAQWFVNGNLIEGATNNELRILDSMQEDVAEYVVEVSNPFGQVQSRPVTLSIRSLVERVEFAAIRIGEDGTLSLELLVEGEGEVRLGLEWSRDLETWRPLEERLVSSGSYTWRLQMIDGESKVNFRITGGL